MLDEKGIVDLAGTVAAMSEKETTAFNQAQEPDGGPGARGGIWPGALACHAGIHAGAVWLATG